MNNKKELAFLVSSHGQAFTAGNIVLGINKYMPNNIKYNIVVYHNSFSKYDIAAFQNIPNVVLNNFSFPQEFIDEMYKKLDKNGRWNNPGGLMTFSHYEIFSLLENYKKVVWLDTDMSIQSNISEIIKFSGFTITDDYVWPVRINFNKTIEGYDMDRKGFCAAFIVVDDSLPFKDIYNWCYNKSIEYAEYLINPDQGIINLALQEFNIIPNILSSNIWQCTPFRPLAHIAKIVHFGDIWKPWMHSAIIKNFPEWYRTHLEWLKLGGTDFPKHAEMDLLNKLTQDDLQENRKKIMIKRIKLFGLTVFKKEIIEL